MPKSHMLNRTPQVVFYSTQSVDTPDTPPAPAVDLTPTQAAQTLATQAATNTTALFVTSPELVGASSPFTSGVPLCVREAAGRPWRLEVAQAIAVGDAW